MVSPKQTKQFLGMFSKISSMLKWAPRLFMLAGIVFIVIGSNNIYRAYKTSNWPSVQGYITSSETKSHSSTYTDTTTNTVRNEVIYNAQINYDYVINGITYSNDDVKVGGTIGTNTTSWTRALLNKYPQKQSVRVYYNPENPYQSVLEKGLHLSTLFSLGLGLAIFIFAIYIKKTFLNIGGLLVSGYNTEQEVSSTTGQSMSSSASDPLLLGKWEVVYQAPSQKELAVYSMKQFNFSVEELSPENIIVPEGKTIVTITENKISFKTQGTNLFGDAGHQYTLQDNRLILAPVKLNIFMNAMAPFMPTYYRYKLSGSELTLTSDEIKGYDNQSIIFHLRRD